MRLNDIAHKLRLAGDETRLKVLCVLFAHAGVCVSDVANRLELSVAIVSHHLQALADDGLVVPERSGKRVCYRLSEDRFASDLKKLICKYK